MSRPFPEACRDRVVPRQLRLNKPLYCAPFPKQKVAFAHLPIIKAIAYEWHIYFGQYYRVQTRSVQLEVYCESCTGQLLHVRVLIMIPSQYA